MNLDLKGHKRKKMGLKRFKNSFLYSLDGLKYAFINEQSLLVHCIVTVLVTILGLILHISIIEWLFTIIMIGLIISLELINTAIEAVVDLTTSQIHPLAKIAKDTASASVLVLALVAGIGAIIIYVPKILELF